MRQTKRRTDGQADRRTNGRADRRDEGRRRGGRVRRGEGDGETARRGRPRIVILSRSARE